VFFPFTQGRVIDESFGSRHRAALGITEETDAVLVVVSEERGSVSFCFNGNIVSDLDGPRLRAALEGVFSPKKTPKRVGAGERLWSMLPSQLLKRRSRLPGVATNKEPTPSEAPPPSVRIRATAPSGMHAPVGPDGAPAAGAAKPLRKSPVRSTGEGPKAPAGPEPSVPPRAPDEST
jgi:hypothetical protein